MTIKIIGDRLYSVNELAVIFDVCEPTIRNWVKNEKLRKAHPVSNQGAILVSGYDVAWNLIKDPRYNHRDNTLEISDERRLEYLVAAKDKCMREISAAETAMKREMSELNEILRELF